MSYSAEISRINPGCIIFLIDQSGSMEQHFAAGDSRPKKAEGVVLAVNRLLQNFIIKCNKNEGVRDYFYISVIGYHGSQAASAFGGALAGKLLVPISEIAQNPLRIEERIRKIDDGAGGLIEQKFKFPIWFDVVADGGTPMCQALTLAHSLVQTWKNAHPDSYPPIVINITDGEASDGSPTNAMGTLTNTSFPDGKVLLFNVHLSSNPQALPLVFPDSPNQLPDQLARTMFDGASELIQTMINVANEEYDYKLGLGAKGFVLNADMSLLVQTLDIGTRPANTSIVRADR